MLQYKYQGREQSQNWDEKTYKETLSGTEETVDAHISGLVIGQFVSGKGYLFGWTKQQENPVLWSLEISYRVTYGRGDKNDYEPDPDEGATSNKEYSLSARNIQVPIEQHPSYRTHWKYYLLAREETTILPAWWATATDTLLDPDKSRWYMWVSSVGEIPRTDRGGFLYLIAAEPTKPGVNYYDEACFVVTESARFRTSSAAGRHIKKAINKVMDPPHTFGITGGEWKCDEGSVQHDGKRWVATQTWTRADTWDKDFYGGSGAE